MSVALSPTHQLARFRAEFPIFQHAVYLNSCSLGALSTRSRTRVDSYLDQWQTRGASAWYDTWLPVLEELRYGYARVLGARPTEMSLHPSISSALTVVAESLDYATRPKVVTTSLDFPTVPFQWLAKRKAGVELVMIKSEDGISVPLEALERAVDGRTALVATSHVFFTSGAIQDVAAVAAIAHRHGALALVDGYQAAGQLPVDVHALDVDFYCGGGLKWLLGGSGTAFLYVRADLIDALSPRVTGWFAQARPFLFDPERLEYRDDARRFDMGTPAMGSVYAQLGGLELLAEAGIPTIREVTAHLTEDLISEASSRGLRPRLAPRREDQSAIIMLPRRDPAGDVRRLAEAGFIVDERPGHVRFSPYFYNLADDHRAALECLARG